MEKSFEKKSEQIIEGDLGKSQDHWQERLPANIKPEIVDILLGSDGNWHWHLKPKYIEDENIRKAYQEERQLWLGE